MNRLNDPKYPYHQVITGQYASVGEFTHRDGSDFEGLYHVLPNGQSFEGDSPEEGSREIFPKNYEITPDALVYNRISRRGVESFVDPEFYYPRISSMDKMNGKITRYFVQKRNNPRNTIMEVDYNQFNSIKANIGGGINSDLWNGISVEWTIHFLSPQETIEKNRLEILKKENDFPGLYSYITDYLEFYL